MGIKTFVLFCIHLILLLSFSNSFGENVHDSNSTNNLNAIRERLSSDFHQTLLKETYASLVNRIEPDGYFHESLNGVYPGMFPRTVGGFGRLLLEVGEYDRTEKLIAYCIQGTIDNKMSRIAHVIGHREKTITPLPYSHTPACLDTSISFAQLNNGLGANQTFVAGSEMLTAIEVFCNIFAYRTNPQCIDINITDTNGTVRAKSSLAIRRDIINSWVRIEFSEPVKLLQGQVYKIHFSCPDDKGTPTLFAREKPEGSCFLVAYKKEGQIENPYPDKTLSIVLDYGNLKHSVSEEKIRLISDGDEVDGQAHILMVWGMLAQQRGHTKFEDDTYNIIARLMDHSTDSPYLSFHTTCRPQPGVVCNIMFEHSRDGSFWHTYDFLTQSFVASALENLIPIAQRRGDLKHVNLWSSRLNTLNANINKNMVRDFEGKKIYLEMLLPTGREPEPFPGLSWVNLAPIPSSWKSVNSTIFRNTIDTWHRVAQIKWDGPRVTSSEWLPEGYKDRFGRQMSNQIIGKALGWDMVYCLKAKEYDRVCNMLDFIEKVNSTKLYAEAFNYDSNSKIWVLQDPGNGEQSVWWCWSMVVLRKAVGLPPLPASAFHGD
ncbi:MAG: hypothetical protein A2Y10_10195 [Planctomycetes bacterium GWF2_41_51]|nr:MAG: hypothetical protein A2Y10_10195 [Planctomycetes bacterium GWF2_41_51]HBG27690.1 hypothetical protein [Phycisphaerales bacterium]